MLALTSQFVVIDDSAPAGQLTEIPLVENARVVTVILRQSGQHSSWMTAGVSNTSAVIREFQYDSDTLDDVVTDALRWAETELERLGRTLDELLPWRKPQT